MTARRRPLGQQFVGRGQAGHEGQAVGEHGRVVLGRRAHRGVRRDRDGEVLVGGAHCDEQDSEVGRDTGHDDVVHPQVAQHGQHLRAVHRRDALMARQHQVVRPHADLGDDLGGGVCPVPLRRRRGRAHQRCPPIGRAPAGARKVGQVRHLDTRGAGAGGEAAHGCHRGPGRLGQRGKDGEVPDDATLAFDEQQRRPVGIARAVPHRSRAPGRLRTSSNLPMLYLAREGPSSLRIPAVVTSRAPVPPTRAPCLPRARGPALRHACPRVGHRQLPEDRQGRPAEAGAHARHRHVQQPTAAAGQRVEARVRRRQPGQRVGDGVRAEHRRPSRPRRPSHRRRRVVAEPDPVGPVTRAPVPGDGDPDLRAARLDQVGAR